MSRILPETQIKAWEDLQGHLKESQSTVYNLVSQFSVTGITLFEMVVISKLPVNRLSGRVTELSDMKLIKDSGARRINPESGKGAIVWVPTKREEYQQMIAAEHNAL